jgi:dTDP-4-dehydrorhamnose reductase
MRGSEHRVLVLGAGGQVGRALVAALGESAIGFDRDGADLSRPESLVERLDAHRPSSVINAAAYTQVDRAESEQALAMTVNGESPGIIARWCAARDVPFIHYSTDYVFDGSGSEPWDEDAPVAPLSVYGASKLAGEQGIAGAGGRWLVIRTSWVYDAVGRNFVTTMLRLMRERSELSVVADQHGAPTYAPHLTSATISALSAALAMPAFPRGIYHLCNAGETTWHGFASAIAESARARGMELAVERINAITSAEYPVPATRPKNSRLNTNKARRVLGVALPDWRQGLVECIEML